MTQRFRHWRNWYTCDVRQSTNEQGIRYLHLVVRKRSGNGGISWDLLQHIKNDVAGCGATAVEVYPPADQMIYEINARHLWVLPTDLTAQLPSLAH